MKTNQLLLILTATLLSFQSIHASAQTFMVKSHRVSVRGTSTLHDFESIVDRIECKGSYTLEANRLIAIDQAVLKIPVTAIKSSKGKMMDSKTWETFNYEANPTITFAVKNAKVSGSIVVLNGTLTMAGKTKPVDVRANYAVTDRGELQLKGSHMLSMTDFGMTPPTAMMGSIKVGNDVTVVFDLTLSNNSSVSLK